MYWLFEISIDLKILLKLFFLILFTQSCLLNVINIIKEVATKTIEINKKIT